MSEARRAGSLEAYLTRLRRNVETALERTLTGLKAPAPIAAALRYALLGGGKRLRPCLTLATAETVGATLGLPPDHSCALAMPVSFSV